MYVKPKKNLGQHFLTSEKIAAQIAGSINYPIDEDKKAGYIAVITSVLKIMEQCIELLGFEAPEKM